MAERKRQTRGKYTARLQRQQALQPSRFQLRREGRGPGGGALGSVFGLLNLPFVAVVAALVAVGLMTVHSITVVDIWSSLAGVSGCCLVGSSGRAGG